MLLINKTTTFVKPIKAHIKYYYLYYFLCIFITFLNLENIYVCFIVAYLNPCVCTLRCTEYPAELGQTKNSIQHIVS